MKNREKFAEQIIDIAFQRYRNMAVNLTSGEPSICGKIKCSECLFSESNKDCEVLLKEWAEKEYEEQSVDWSKVAVDTPILVRDSEKEVWEKNILQNMRTEKCTHGVQEEHLGVHALVP